ncbi:MAG: hypothetical protein IKQ23_09675, partial [Treponema sp.]|nr:hypothetical protein [Treponema sp.]
ECFDVIAEDAYETGRKLVQQEGFFVGQSAGAALWTATQVAKRPEAKGKNIVVILADNAFKYLQQTCTNKHSSMGVAVPCTAGLSGVPPFGSIALQSACGGPLLSLTRLLRVK